MQINYNLLQEDTNLQYATFILCKKLLEITKTSLPHDMKDTDLIRGDCDIDLSYFLQTLICDADKRTRNSRMFMKSLFYFSRYYMYQ